MEENFQILLDAVLRPDIGPRIQKQLDSLGLSVPINMDSKAVSNLQKQFKNVDTAIDVQLGNTKDIVKDAQKVGAQAAAAMNRELSNGLSRTGVKSPFSDIDTSIQIKPVLDDKGLVDLEATLQKLRAEFADFGQVTLTNQKYGLDKQLQSFTVRIQQVKGELKDITSFNMGLNDDGLFSISGDVLRRTEQMVQHLDEARNASNETAENVQLQEQAYKRLITSTQEYYRLQTKLLKAGKENRAELEKQRDAARSQIADARQTINNNNLTDPTREAKYEATRTKSQNRYNDAVTAQSDRQNTIAARKAEIEYNKKVRESLSNLQKAYKKYQSTYTSVTQKMSKLNSTDDAGEINALSENLDDVENTYVRLRKEFQKLIKGNNEYAQTWIEIRDNIFRAAEAQRRVIEGSQSDDLRQRYSDIQTAVTDGRLRSQTQGIRTIVENYRSRNFTSDSLDRVLSQLETTGQRISDTVTSGSVSDIKSVISQYEEWLDLLKQTNAELKSLKQSSKWTSRRDSMLNDIDTYLESNKGMSNDMRQNFLSLRNEINNAVQGVDLSPMQRQISSLKRETRAAGMEGRTWFEEIRNNVGKVVDWLGATTIVMGALNQVQRMIDNVRELDSAMTDLRMVTGDSIEDTQKLMKSYSDLADQLKVTVTDVASASNDWLRQGYDQADVATLTTDSIIMSRISGLDAAESTEYLTTAMKGYRVEAEDALNVVDKLSAVDMASATDVGGLAEGMSRVAANAELAGVSMDKLLGYLAVIGESSGEDMSSVGRTLNAIFSRMGNIKLSRLDSYQNESGEDLSNVETVLRGEGISLRDASGQFRNFGEVLDEVAGNWNNYDSVSQRAIANAMAGTEHLSDFILLMRDYSTATDYATTAADANGEAMEKYSAYTESIEGRMEQFKNSFLSLSDAVINSDLVKDLTSIVTVLTDMATALINVTELIPGVDGGFSTLAGLAGAFLGARGAGYVITYISTNVYKARENCYCIR